MFVSAIVLAAGAGSRFRSNIPKPLAKIKSKPVIIYCLETLGSHPLLKDIILVVNAKNSGCLVNAVKKYRIGKIRRVVNGGRRRQDSVYNALGVIDAKTDLVLIHDGVRPFIDRKLVSELIYEAKISGAAVPAVPVKATIKKVTKSQSHKVTSKFVVKETIDRNELWEAQTPQVFRKELILKAYKKFRHLGVTDDATLVEKLGKKVSIVAGSYSNIKITTQEDLAIAKACLDYHVK